MTATLSPHSAPLRDLPGFMSGKASYTKATPLPTAHQQAPDTDAAAGCFAWTMYPWSIACECQSIAWITTIIDPTVKHSVSDTSSQHNILLVLFVQCTGCLIYCLHISTPPACTGQHRYMDQLFTAGENLLQCNKAECIRSERDSQHQSSHPSL